MYETLLYKTETIRAAQLTEGWRLRSCAIPQVSPVEPEISTGRSLRTASSEKPLLVKTPLH